ncbi:MAG: hypothetical protein CL799_13585 [Chromatiales bacterium]|jgi:outer membrane scaffolding protein for murein synthesis (MipA/OmpV family)|nr:hypothetical protein [Chromatiales bacterium]MDP6151055.1 MipA/OmpV family protein [Gammaproteobacteria bacterium]HJP04265.1 MipA/OmpV family protein [Gammaproteobacteria bacterium]
MRQLLVIATLISLTGNCLAADRDLTTDDTQRPAEKDPLPLWEWKLAEFNRYGPAYPASEDTQVDIFLLPFPIYRGKILRIGDDAEKPVRTRIFHRDRIKVDIDFGFNFPADSDDVDARDDMPDLDPLIEAGPEFELRFADKYSGGDLFLAIQARGAWSMDGLDPSSEGAIFTTELRYEKFFPKTKLVVKLQPEWASGDYMDYFYGVEEEFVTADRPAYDAKGGYLGTKVGFSLRRQLSDQLEIVWGARFGYFKGARNDNSPLFTDETNTNLFVAFLWKFWEGKTRATAE